MRSTSFVFFIVIFITLVLYSLIIYNKVFTIQISESVTYLSKVIVNIENHPKIRSSEDKIFFVESHSAIHHNLSGRQACSIESAGTHQCF